MKYKSLLTEMPLSEVKYEWNIIPTGTPEENIEWCYSQIAKFKKLIKILEADIALARKNNKKDKVVKSIRGK